MKSYVPGYIPVETTETLYCRSTYRYLVDRNVEFKLLGYLHKPVTKHENDERLYRFCLAIVLRETVSAGIFSSLYFVLFPF